MKNSTYWAVAKYTFAVVGGGAAATALVVGTYKGVKGVVSKLANIGKSKDVESN